MPATYLPQRKLNRLPSYDYSAPGAYFVTFCTHNKRPCLWNGENLSAAGMLVQQSIAAIAQHYPAVTVANYVIMPNHVHLLLQICADETGCPQPAPTVSQIIQQLKGHTARHARDTLWQKSFHDHVIRSEADFLRIWDYIDNNPATWKEDCFYCPDDPTTSDFPHAP